MKKQYCLLFVLLTSVMCLNAQQKKLPLSIQFGGYVHTLFTYDTRQTVSAREGHILFYPANELLDAQGKDINRNPVFHMAVIQSRLHAKIKGPEILGAQSNGLLEAEFVGNGESDVNGFRLRHAFVNLDWGNTSLLLGQTWSPLFVAEVFPVTVGANAGLPFKPFARNPQLRLTHCLKNWKFLFALASERDYTSTGPDGSGNQYLKNAGLPIFQAQLHHCTKNCLLGISGEYKKLKPSLMSSTGSHENGDYKQWKNDEAISSWALMSYVKLNVAPLTFKAQTTYGTNMTNVLMLGGYAVKDLNPETNEASYTGIRVLGTWAEFSYQKNNWDWAFFGGYSKNLGAEDFVVNQLIYARGKDIASLYRLAPRVCKSHQNLKFEFEVEYTATAYGTLTEKAKVINTNRVANTRFSLGISYFFNSK